MYKLNRLWQLSATDEHFTIRSIPPETRDYNRHFTDDNKLIAIFDKSVKYLLIEAYGLDSFYETDDGLYFEFDYTNHNYMLSWLLSFGDKVKVLEPPEIVTDIQTTAKNILSYYNQHDI